jgi:dipeptidyl aminopeptidase/acylaminoacyl peptidase
VSAVTEHPDWVRRFTATDIGFPAWDDGSPDHLAIVTNRSGGQQSWAHDLADGSWRQMSDEPVGVEVTWMLPGDRVAWWRDTTGDERGLLMAMPFAGGQAEPVFPSLPEGWLMGHSFEAGIAAISMEIGGAYRTYLIERDGTARVLADHEAAAGVGSLEPGLGGGLSADGALVCIQHAEHGDLLHAALRVLDTRAGEVVGELEDKGRNLDPVAWSPVSGDQRLAFTSELGAFERPAIWDVRSGERRDLAIDLPGGVFPVRWWADASALLCRHEHEGRAQLVRIDLATGATAALTGLDGDIDGAGIRPDGSVWYRVSDAVRAPRIMQTGGGEVVASPDAPPPAGRPYATRFATNAHGDRIQMFVATPDGPGPFPTVCNIHGGPEWHERDRFDAETQAFVDRGYAVAIVNYRGSTGYGIAFREALVHNVCFTETEDILACVDALVADGTTDPGRVFWSGWSWGGCLACFNAGMHPDRWRAIFAGIPAGDFVAAHHASAPELQAWDEAVYGGTPEQVPDRYARSDPMTHVDAVRAPVLVIAGEADPRCPIEGVTPWVDALRARNHPVEVDLYPEGHHTNSMQGQVAHMRRVLDFFDRYR